MTNAGTGSAHLVYVRRKPDADLARSTASSDGHCVGTALHSSQPGKTIHQDEATHNKSLQLKESSSVCSPQVSPIPKHPPSLGFSSARPTALQPSPGNSTNILSPANLDHLPTNPMLSTPAKLNAEHWEERSCKLNNSLKKLDQSDQKDYIESLLVVFQCFDLFPQLNSVSMLLNWRRGQFSFRWRKRKSFNEFKSLMSWRDTALQSTLKPTVHASKVRWTTNGSVIHLGTVLLSSAYTVIF